MKVIYALQPFPKSFRKAIFLVGPTPRIDKVTGKPTAPSWRPEALRILAKRGYDGVVFVPETQDKVWKHEYDDQIRWETEGLHLADRIVCWVPRDLKTMPAFTTNHEHGAWYRSGKTVLGAPPSAPKMRYLQALGAEVGEPQAETLEATIDLALADIGEGAFRNGGETQVPIDVWRTPSFQAWYRAQLAVGNRLDGARVEWTFRVGPRRQTLFVWALHVDVFVANEGRNKSNEVVLGRPDISSVVLHGPQKGLDTDIVLVREFRSTGLSPDGFVHEVPGGSSFKATETPAVLAANEVREETGLSLKVDRVVMRQARQLNATFSSHRAHLFSAQLTEEELVSLRECEGLTFGEDGSSERTYVEVRTLGDILKKGDVDWANLGMILSVVRS